MTSLNLLIAEDNLTVISRLMDRIVQSGLAVSPLIVTSSRHLRLIPISILQSFDLILLDRNDGQNQSFHCLDFASLSPQKIIGISSVPAYNRSLSAYGITLSVSKDYTRLNSFLDQIISLLSSALAQKQNP